MKGMIQGTINVKCGEDQNDGLQMGGRKKNVNDCEDETSGISEIGNVVHFQSTSPEYFHSFTD